MQNLGAYGVFLTIMVGLIAAGLFIEPVKVLTLLVWALLVAVVIGAAEAVFRKKAG